MSLHVFGAIVTGAGTAANNRGLTEGNITTLQKLLWNGQVHTTVSAESIRFALRRYLGEKEPLNRNYSDDARTNTWEDPEFAKWGASKGKRYIDDDLLGYMSAKAAKQDGDEDGEGKPGKGTAKVRRSVLEVTRAVSLTPWAGDVTFNAASPGATPSAQKKGANPVPYGTEVHATRYQYGFALTPSRIADEKAKRAGHAIRGLCSIGSVAGNHGRFLFDFSPESVVFRVTHEAAPRILYPFSVDNGEVQATELLRKVRAGDVPAKELVIGGVIVARLTSRDREALKEATLFEGVVVACEEVCKRIDQLVKE